MGTTSGIADLRTVISHVARSTITLDRYFFAKRTADGDPSIQDNKLVSTSTTAEALLWLIVLPSLFLDRAAPHVHNFTSILLILDNIQKLHSKTTQNRSIRSRCS